MLNCNFYFSAKFRFTNIDCKINVIIRLYISSIQLRKLNKILYSHKFVSNTI